jgi:hypothetical protein
MADGGARMGAAIFRLYSEKTVCGRFLSRRKAVLIDAHLPKT